MSYVALYGYFLLIRASLIDIEAVYTVIVLEYSSLALTGCFMVGPRRFTAAVSQLICRELIYKAIKLNKLQPGPKYICN